MSRTVIRGGTVLDQSGERRLDVAIDDGRVIEVGQSAQRRPDPRRRRLHRRSRPGRPPRAPARAGSGGRRDDRDRQPRRGARRVHGDRGDAEHRAGAGLAVGDRVRPRPGPTRRVVRRPPGRMHHDESRGQGAGAVRRTGRGRGTPVHRRRQRRAGSTADASRPRIRPRPRHHPGAALRGDVADQGRGDARGLVLQPPRSAGLAGDRRGADGPSRHRTVASHRGPRPPAASLDGAQRRTGARRQGRGRWR